MNTYLDPSITQVFNRSIYGGLNPMNKILYQNNTSLNQRLAIKGHYNGMEQLNQQTLNQRNNAVTSVVEQGSDQLPVLGRINQGETLDSLRANNENGQGILGSNMQTQPNGSQMITENLKGTNPLDQYISKIVGDLNLLRQQTGVNQQLSQQMQQIISQQKDQLNVQLGNNSDGLGFLNDDNQERNSEISDATFFLPQTQGNNNNSEISDATFFLPETQGNFVISKDELQDVSQNQHETTDQQSAQQFVDRLFQQAR